MGMRARAESNRLAPHSLLLSCCTKNIFTACIILLCAPLSTVFATFDGKNFDGSLEYAVNGAPCVRLFTNEGDMGCRTLTSQSVGALYEVQEFSDISRIFDIKVDSAVLSPSHFLNETLLETLKSISKVKGLIVYDDWIPTKNDGLFSPDVQSPQGQGTYQENFTLGSVKWNNFGNGQMYSSFDFPIVHMPSAEDIARLKEMCSENRKYGLSSNRVNVAEFQYYMGKHGVTSLTCLAWKDIYGNKSPQCLPLGGASVWATAGVLDDRKKVVVTTGIDSTAFFHDLSFGANDAAASIIVILSAAEVIGRSLPSSFPYQPLFFLSNAEEWGYAGSRRFVRDIVKGISCSSPVESIDSSSGLPLCTDPVYPSTLFANMTENSIADIVAIDQVGSLPNGELYIHSSSQDSPTSEALLNIDFGLDGYGLSQSSLSGSIPPTPLSSFLSGMDTLKNGGVVISGYDDVFDNPTYHSRFDANYSSVNARDVIAAATILAKSVVSMCGGDVASVAAVNEAWTASILDCLVTSWNCPMMSNYVSAEKSNIEDFLHGEVSIDMGTEPPNYYTGTLNAVSGGLPVVKHGQYIYGKYSGAWNSEHDRAFIIPNALEAFIRSSLSYHLNVESISERESAISCDSSSECGNCSILNFDAVRMECILKTCICPTASYHLAVDPGLEADVYPNQFIVLDDETPCFTEPYWRDIGLRVYPKANSNILIVSLVVGLSFVILRYKKSRRSDEKK